MTQRAKNGGGKGKRAPKKKSEVQKARDHMAASVHDARQWAATITSETAEEGLVDPGVLQMVRVVQAIGRQRGFNFDDQRVSQLRVLDKDDNLTDWMGPLRKRRS
ncbi:hypothetical protein FISHEDRAFT_60402 [Fistulina hepatica ATCC 64428]|uniref:Uncharacterized protein n=1 Tax=Fistulina hepatica ATCC 64428 TaxID=1128425 RepID=A0A0D7A6L7_9AGAR|nr:hypothetical protein FISHEDRAFT_60402 [Fistulina hepatica ATCC 64428]